MPPSLQMKKKNLFSLEISREKYSWFFFCSCYCFSNRSLFLFFTHCKLSSKRIKVSVCHPFYSYIEIFRLDQKDSSLPCAYQRDHNKLCWKSRPSQLGIRDFLSEIHHLWLAQSVGRKNPLANGVCLFLYYRRPKSSHNLLKKCKGYFSLIQLLFILQPGD